MVIRTWWDKVSYLVSISYCLFFFFLIFNWDSNILETKDIISNKADSPNLADVVIYLFFFYFFFFWGTLFFKKTLFEKLYPGNWQYPACHWCNRGEAGCGASKVPQVAVVGEVAFLYNSNCLVVDGTTCGGH